MSKINMFDDLLENLAKSYSISTKTKIGRKEIFDALFVLLSDKENIEWSGDLWDIKLSELDAEAIISDFDFKTLTTIFEFDQDPFIKDFLYQKKVRFKSNGLIWLIHKNDKDPFPSNPHAHNLEQNLKLDLSNGNYYRNRKLLRKLNKKDFLILREHAEKVYHGKLPQIKI